MRIRISKEEKEAKKKKEAERQEEIGHLRSELGLIYARISSARASALVKLDEYLEKIETGSSATDIDNAKTTYEGSNKVVEEIKKARDLLERKAKRLFPKSFAYLS